MLGVKVTSRYAKRIERATLFSYPETGLDASDDSRFWRMSKASLEQVARAWNWQPIRNCPGRYALRGADRHLTVEAIAGGEIEVSEFQSAAARDTVLVAALAGGGLISYRRADGSLVHTLNTREGFARKLKQLGIEAADS